MREVEAYRRFKHPNIIRILGSAVVQDPEGEGQIVYLFLPLYKRDNLQDVINCQRTSLSRTRHGTIIPRDLFSRPCHANTPGSAMPTNRNGATDPSASSTAKLKQQQQQDDDGDNDERFPQAEGDAEGGYSYDGPGLGSSVPLVTRHRAAEDELENDIVFDGDEELHQHRQANSTLAVVPYAHRDLKPGHVIVFGSDHPHLN